MTDALNVILFVRTEKIMSNGTKPFYVSQPLDQNIFCLISAFLVHDHPTFPIAFYRDSNVYGKWFPWLMLYGSKKRMRILCVKDNNVRVGVAFSFL